MEYDVSSGSLIVMASVWGSYGGSTDRFGNTIDTAGYGGVEFIVPTGVLSTGSVSLDVQQAPDVGGSPGAWATVTDDEILGSKVTIVATTNNQSVFRIGSIGKERFQRIVFRVVTAYTGFGTMCYAVLSDGTNPQAAQAT
jgi:hypothetical protein